MIKDISLILQLITVSIITLQKESKHQLNANRDKWLNSYDYIIVGAGSAGSVVANRLAEDPNIRVLLLEAGRAASVVTDIPGITDRLRGSDFDWNYTTVRQNNYGLAVNGLISLPRGRVIGGTSAINSMVYNRGNRRGFDDWAQTYGAKGWSFDEVLPYFKKSENNLDLDIVRQNQPFHGTGEPVSVSSDPNPQQILTHSLRAFNELGLGLVDVNGAQQTGTTFSQLFVDGNGIRSSAGNAYIDPNPYPHNLHILSNAFVIKILFQKTNSCLKTIGVQFIKNNKLYEVMADNEVIVSAGTFNSPQLLMLSGIGPKEHLRKFNIKVLVDLPVGDHLRDHPIVQNIFAIIKPNVLVNERPQLNVEQLYQLYVNGSGPLAREGAGLTYLSTDSNPIKEWPNALIFYYNFFINSEITARVSNRTNEWINYYKPYIGLNVLNLSPHLVRVRSIGSVRLSSDNPFDYPLIDPKFMSNPQDLEDLVEVIKFSLSYLATSSISNYVELITDPIPGCQLCPDRPIYECDQYIQCLIRQTGDSNLHPVGTCRMGSIDRSDVVVDERLNVKNVCGLRVCDASVMPNIPNANTNAATIMIGEKCSDLIKQNYI